MRLLKLRNPRLQIRPAITEDFSRHPRVGHRRRQLLIHHVPIRRLHRIQRDRLHILMAQTPPRRRQRGEAHAQNHQTFLRAQLDRMIQDPHPVRCVLFGPRQFVVADPQQP